MEYGFSGFGDCGGFEGGHVEQHFDGIAVPAEEGAEQGRDTEAVFVVDVCAHVDEELDVLLVEAFLLRFEFGDFFSGHLGPDFCCDEGVQAVRAQVVEGGEAGSVCDVRVCFFFLEQIRDVVEVFCVDRFDRVRDQCPALVVDAVHVCVRVVEHLPETGEVGLEQRHRGRTEVPGVHRVRVRARPEQEVDDFGVAVGAGVVQRRVSGGVRFVEKRALLQQEGGDLEVAVFAGQQQRRALELVFCEHFRAVLHQELHHFEVALRRRDVQQRLAVRAGHGDLHAAVEQQLDHVHVSVLGRVVNRGVPEPIFEVGDGPVFLQQEADVFDSPGPRRVHQRRGPHVVVVSRVDVLRDQVFERLWRLAAGGVVRGLPHAVVHVDVLGVH